MFLFHCRCGAQVSDVTVAHMTARASKREESWDRSIGTGDVWNAFGHSCVLMVRYQCQECGHEDELILPIYQYRGNWGKLFDSGEGGT